jgi:hypothetical protein
MSREDDHVGEVPSAAGLNGRSRGGAASPERVVVRPFSAHRSFRRGRDFSESLQTLGRVFDNLETLQLQCSVLQAEKSQSQIATDKIIEGAFARIEDLEAVVTGLMRIVAKYDKLLSQSNGRRKEAEQRAVHAEIRVKETERGASEAVEWLYRYMADSLHTSR